MEKAKCGISGCGYLTEAGSSFCKLHQPVQQIPMGGQIIKDTINPYHYKQGGIETIDYMQAKMTPVQFEGYLLGNVFKYLSRYQYKNGLEDVKKAEWYVNKLVQTLEQRS